MTTATRIFIKPSTPTSTLNLSRRRGWIILTPFVVSFGYCALLTFKPTRRFALLMSQENYPVELLTFALMLAGGIYGLCLAMRARRQRPRGLPSWVIAFYLMFSVFLVLIAMEEISWGQWFFHFHTPGPIARINTQHEFNLHNLQGMGGNTVWLRLAFGVGGLLGTALGLHPTLEPVAAAPRLRSWFLVIAVFAAGDIVTDFVGVDTPLDVLFESMRELIELLIAGAACLYLWLNSKALLLIGQQGLVSRAA
jgi:hypothetical protein